jgi:iron complex outermembrane receptor protein
MKKIFRNVMLMLILPAAILGQEDISYFYWGDTVTVVGDKSLLLPTVNAIAAKMPLALHETPASVGVVTRAVFKEQNGMILSDALKNISGVNVQHDFGTHDFFLIRGFDSLTGGLVLTDGAAEPEVSFYNLYNIERVEVLKGPGAFLYGGNPLSGAVNLVRKQPAPEDFTRVSGGYGQFQSFRGTFDINQTNGHNLAFRMNGLFHNADGFRDKVESQTTAINPALTWRIDNQSTLTTNLEYVNSNQRPDAGLPIQYVPDFMTFSATPQIPDITRSRSFQTPLDDSEQEMWRLRVDYTRKLSQSFSVRNKTYFTRLDWASQGTLLGGAVFDTSAFNFGNYNVIRTLQTLDDDQTLFGNQLEGLLNFSTGSVKHTLVTGIELARLKDNFDIDIATPIPAFGLNLDLIIDLNNPDEKLTDIGQLVLTPYTNGTSKSFVAAPYLVNRTSLTEKFQVFYGGRFDVINYEKNAMAIGPQGQPVPVTVDRNYSKFSPMVGFMLKPSDTFSLYGNVGQAFAPPSSIALEDTDPEESRQFEAGAKGSYMDGKLNTSVSFFHLERDNIAIPDNVTGAPTQTGNQRSRGVEFEFSAQPAKGWQAFFNYAYTDAELTEFRERNLSNPLQINDFSGNTPAFVPEHIINCWSSKQLENGIGFGLGTRYVGAQFIDEDDAFEIDSYLTIDAMISYTYSKWRWSLNFKNITDKDYETRGGFGSFSITPADPFTVFGSLDFAIQ